MYPETLWTPPNRQVLAIAAHLAFIPLSPLLSHAVKMFRKMSSLLGSSLLSNSVIVKCLNVCEHLTPASDALMLFTRLDGGRQY
jgi:hypothetical protein